MHSVLLSSIIAVIIWCFLAADSLAVGYAPVGVLGTVTREGEPVSASVWLKAFVDGVEVTQSDAMTTNAAGMFYNVVTVKDGVVVDVQVTIEVGDEVFVELLRGAQGWNDYNLSLELSTESFVSVAPEHEVQAPSDAAFERDFQLVLDDPSSAEAFAEKYDVPVEPLDPLRVPESGSSPVLERPLSFVRAPENTAAASWPGGWQIGAVIALVGCIIFLRWEFKRHRS